VQDLCRTVQARIAGKPEKTTAGPVPVDTGLLIPVVPDGTQSGRARSTGFTRGKFDTCGVVRQMHGASALASTGRESLGTYFDVENPEGLPVWRRRLACIRIPGGKCDYRNHCLTQSRQDAREDVLPPHPHGVAARNNAGLESTPGHANPRGHPRQTRPVQRLQISAALLSAVPTGLVV